MNKLVKYGAMIGILLLLVAFSSYFVREKSKQDVTFATVSTTPVSTVPPPTVYKVGYIVREYDYTVQYNKLHSIEEPIHGLRFMEDSDRIEASNGERTHWLKISTNKQKWDILDEVYVFGISVPQSDNNMDLNAALDKESAWYFQAVIFDMNEAGQWIYYEATLHREYKDVIWELSRIGWQRGYTYTIERWEGGVYDFSEYSEIIEHMGARIPIYLFYNSETTEICLFDDEVFYGQTPIGCVYPSAPIIVFLIGG